MDTRLLTRGRARPSEPIAVAPDPIAAARAEVRRLRQAELGLTDKRAALAATLIEAEQSAGDATLAAALGGGSTAAAIGQVAALRAEAEAIDRAIDSARRQRRDAIIRVWQAEAVPLRERAAELGREAAERQRKTDSLLRELREFEGCDYLPAPLTTDRPIGEQQGGSPRMVLLPTPITAMMLIEADGLEAQATAIERRTVSDRGAIGDATGSEDLITRVRTWDAMTIAPPLHAVMTWAREAEAQQQARIARLPIAEQELCAIALTLVWADGAIDRRQSRAGVPALDP